jgi:hypothetical protein
MSLNSLLKSVTGQTGSGLLKGLGKSESVRDFQHAARLFTDNAHALVPKHQFLYHVFFKINPRAITSSMWGQQDSIKKIEAGMLVKAVDLPKYKVDSKTLNAYNKSQIIQTKIKYDPISITLHDDSANVVRDLWYAYLSFYFRDTDHLDAAYKKGSIYGSYDARSTTNWGYRPLTPVGAENEPFFTSIEIYSLSQKKFSKYELVNPIIESFEHGRHEASNATGIMEHTMRVSYETVKYSTGLTNTPGSANPVSGFAQQHYDKQPSPLTPLGGGTRSILGPGGLIDSASSITQDLADGNFLRAGFTALRAGKNLKELDIKKSIKTEAVGLVTGAIRNAGNTSNPFSFPTIDVARTATNRINQALRTTSAQAASQRSVASSGIATSQGVSVLLNGDD